MQAWRRFTGQTDLNTDNRSNAGGVGGQLPLQAGRSPGPFGIPTTLWLLWMIYVLTASGRVGNQDVEVTLGMSRAMLEGRVELPEKMAGSVQGRGGIWTSPYGVGHSLYLTPYLALGRAAAKLVPKLPVVMWEEFVVSFSNVPVIAGLMAYLVAAWRRVGATEARVAVGVGLFGLCSMLWPYAKLPFSDSLLALSVFAAWFHWTHGAVPKGALTGGVWLGAALVSRRQADAVVPILVLLAGVDTWRRGNAGRMGWLFLGLVPAVALRLAFNWARFGDVFLEQHPGLVGVGEVVRSEPAARLWEVLFSSSYGFLPYNLVPLAVLVAGMAGLCRHRRNDAIVALAMLVGGIGFLSLMRFGSGVSFGSRYLLFTVAFLGLAWPFVPRPGPGWMWWAWGPVFAGSLWLMAGGATLDSVPVMFRVKLASQPLRQWKGFYGEWGRVLSTSGRSDLPELESNPIWHHDAFRRPDFWWCHLAARVRASGLVSGGQAQPATAPERTAR